MKMKSQNLVMQQDILPVHLILFLREQTLYGELKQDTP